MGKIVTVTLNPALDKTTQVRKLVPGGLNRLENIVLDAGGKGINVSKMIAALGGNSIASGFLGGGSGEEIARMLHGLRIQADFVKTGHPTRTNLKVHSVEYGITEFNEPGDPVSDDDMDALKKKLTGHAAPDTTFVFAGSLPRDTAPNTYADLIHMVKAKGATVFLDTDGAAFRAAIEAKPDYIKPNTFELMQYFGKRGAIEVEGYAALCQHFIEKGIKMVAVSMGAAGALFVTATKTLFTPGLVIQARSTVGAGDSMVGALVYAFHKGMALHEAAALGIAASAGAAVTEGTTPPSREVVDELLKQVKVQ
ncbi:MAG: 1-phosphofructokinase [Oscillospiraceae bacterium]|nr:1-phosphofructokinase [Oscillospiraceae bacterium]